MTFFKTVIILAVLGVAYAAAGPQNGSPRLAESKILAKIEKLRQQWISNGFDPYKFNESQFHLDGLGLTLDIKATGLIKGMLDFNISNFSFNIKVGGGYKFAFDMELPAIEANFEAYNLDGWYGIFPLFGNGAVQAKLSGIHLHGEGELETINSDDGILLSLGKYSCSLQVKNSPYFIILGWLKDDARSQMLTNLFNDNVKFILETKSAEISAKLQEKVLNWAEGKTIPLQDVISY